MIKFGGQIKIYSISAFKSIELVIDEMIKLNFETLSLRKEDVLDFCRFSIINNRVTKLVRRVNQFIHR